MRSTRTHAMQDQGTRLAPWLDMPRALWKGLVSFGLVNIPVELHTATRDHAPRFRLLHRTDESPIHMERVCQRDGKAVAWTDLVKGYEVEPGRFVTLTEDDFKTAAMERSRSIDILAFVPVEAIDARYWETPYAVHPGRGAEHSYALLARTLAATGRAGIAKYVMRQRQHLAALVVVEGALLVCTMRFAEDLLALPSAGTAKLNEKELTLARKLVEGMSDDWHPEQYTDDYVKELMNVIDTKAAGKTPKASAIKRQTSTKVVDLVARLQQSLEAAQQSKTARTSRATEKGARAAKATRSRKTTSRKAAARKRRAA